MSDLYLLPLFVMGAALVVLFVSIVLGMGKKAKTAAAIFLFVVGLGLEIASFAITIGMVVAGVK